MTSLLVSASTTASCRHFIAVSKSTISPLRTPRDGAWPTPRILIVPSGRPSPTTTQILEVPISRPTIRSLLAISLILSALLERNCFTHRRCRLGPCFRRRRCFFLFLHRLNGNRLEDSRLRTFRIDRFVNYIHGVLRERYRNVALHEKIDGPELLLR